MIGKARTLVVLLASLVAGSLVEHSHAQPSQPGFQESIDEDGYKVLEVHFAGNAGSYALVNVTASGIQIWVGGVFHQFPAQAQSYNLEIYGSSYDDLVDIQGLDDDLLYIEIYLRAGNDAVNNFTSNWLYFEGEEGNDVLQGGNGQEYFRGGPGNDVAFGGGGEDELSGGPGQDELWGQESNDVLRGGTESDILVGGLGDDELYGNDSWKDLHLFGQSYLRPDFEVDEMHGGLGADKFHHRFYYWQKTSSGFPGLPLVFKLYHEQDQVMDYLPQKDQLVEHYVPKIPLRLP